MKKNTSIEQSIAVFGESGSGKTVLVSSFYGGTQEPGFARSSAYRVLAKDTGQGIRLHRNYLGMRDSNVAPAADEFKATSYAFDVNLKPSSDADRSTSHTALRLTWHDYPGEWFEQDPSGPVEQKRRVETFRSLLSSDVALLVVDGQRLLDNKGEEERYLKALFTNYRNMLLRLQSSILEDGVRLTDFPRIWVVALTKSDLLPQMGTTPLRDMVVGRAGGELDQLRETIAEFITEPAALSLGEDFVCLSSARFLPDRIEVTQWRGLNLILPIAAVLPLERQMKWMEFFAPPRNLLESLASQGSAGLKTAANWLSSLKGDAAPVKYARVVGMVLTSSLAEHLLDPSIEVIRKANQKAVAKKDAVGAVLTSLTIDLKEGEEDDLLLVGGR